MESGDSPLLPAVELPDHGLRASRGGGALQPETSAASAPSGSRINLVRMESSPVPSMLTLLGADSPEVRSRKLILDSAGRAASVERVEALRLLRYRLQHDGSRLTASLSPGDAAAKTPEEEPAPPPSGLVTFQVLAVDPVRVTLRLRAMVGTEIKDLTAPVPRPLLWRLLLGKDIDTTPGQPLRGLDPLPPSLGESRRLMVFTNRAQARPPWEGGSEPLAGEEDPVRLAGAMRRWWASEAGGSPGPSVVVGTDPLLSASRWEKSPRPAGRALLLLPEDGFPGFAAPLRQELSDASKNSKAPATATVASSLPDVQGIPSLVLLVSAEAPGRLARRLRELADNPVMQGKLLAIWPLHQVAKDLAVLAGALANADAGKQRVEDLPGSLVWFF